MTEEIPAVKVHQEARQWRLDQQALVEEEFALALAFLKQNDYKKALRAFKKVFQQDSSHSLTFSRKEIARLVRNYPPAKAVVRRWRNDKEQLILNQSPTRELVDQWVTLNKALGESARTLEFFYILRKSGADEESQAHLLGHLWKQLLKKRKYEEIKPHFRSLGFFLLLNVSEYHSDIWFPRRNERSKEATQLENNYNYRRVVDDGPLTYELALGLNQFDLAAEFSRRILEVERSDLIYAALIRGAIRARAYAEAERLHSDAKDHFGARRLRESNKAIKTIPPIKVGRSLKENRK